MTKNTIKYFIFFIVGFAFLVSCAKRSPEPIIKDDIAKQIQKDLLEINETTKDKVLEIDLYQAIAFAIKNNRELRVNVMESALNNNQIALTEFDMLPKLALDAGYKNLGKNPASTSVSMTGQEPGVLADSPSYSLSQDKNSRTTDLGFTWNALDFGLSYIRAGQNADKFLIAKEMERKAIHNITREVIYAYWQTLSADKLLAEIYPLMDRVNTALDDFEYIEELLLSSPMDALLYQKELLDVAQVLLSQQRSLMNSRTELSSLMGMLPGQEYALVETKKPLTELTINLKTMEEAALFSRPELMESRYLQRISAEEVKASMLALMPSLQFNSTWNYNSNKYLLNKSNYEFGSQIGGNLINIFRAPITRKTAEAAGTVVEQQRLALSMAILSQVHLSNINYAQAIREYSNARHYLNVSNRINEQIKNAQKISRFGALEVIREEASMLVAQLRHDISYAEVQYSLGTIFSSIGMNFTPKEIGNYSENELAQFIKQSMDKWTKKYYAEVAKPIKDQNPVLKRTGYSLMNIDRLRTIKANIPTDPRSIPEFRFANDTFYLTGHGKVRYLVTLANGEPLPNWLVFIPTDKKFIGNAPFGIEELDILIEASNDVVKTEERFTLKLRKNPDSILSLPTKYSTETLIAETEEIVIEEDIETVVETIIEKSQTMEDLNLQFVSNTNDLQEKVDNLVIKKRPTPNTDVLMATLTDTLSKKLESITAYKTDQAAFIQIGAFKSESVSNKVAQDISQKISKDVIVSPTFISDPIFYRILVGPTHKDDVFGVIKLLVDLGIKDYFLTSN